MNRNNIIEYIYYLYKQFIDLYCECNEFDDIYPNNLKEEGKITKIIYFKKNEKVIFEYLITKHWNDDEYNNKIIKIELLDVNNNVDELTDMIKIFKL